MYVTVADARREGVTIAQASDERLESLIAAAEALVDHLTGWVFAPLILALRLDGNDGRTLEPPLPPIRLDTLSVNGEVIPPSEYVAVGAPVGPYSSWPRISLTGGRRFRRGDANVLVSGVWGYTEADGSPLGRTPLAIQRAVLMLLMKSLTPLADEESQAQRNTWRLIEERTRDQSYKLAPEVRAGHLTGDPEIDEILLRYRRPFGIGAA